MAPKAKGEGKGGSPASLLNGKSYKESVNDLFATTAMQSRDIDQKALQLLDALAKEGKAEEGCQHLKTNLEGIAREKVQNWRAYVYSLLRAFDADIYASMKEKAGGSRRAAGNAGKYKPAAGLNAKAADFQPGVWWQGNATSGAFAPQVPAYPMNMMTGYPQMAQAGMAGGQNPPPAPQKAPEVPKTDATEAPAAPDKPADATVKEGDKPAAEAEKGDAR